MSWSAPSANDVLAEFTPSESAVIRTAQGANNLAAILARVVAEVRDFIRSGGYALDADTAKIPLGLHNDAIAIARWRLLISISALKQMQTEERKKAAEAAHEKLGLIAAQKFAVEPPASDTPVNRAGTWNSENKLIMRTHPTPKPGSQMDPAADDYANPDAQEDAEPV